MRLRGVIALAALNPSAQFSTAVTRRATSRVLPRATHALATSSPNAGAESYTLQKVSGGTRVGLPPPLTIQTMPKDIEDTIVKPDGAAAPARRSVLASAARASSFQTERRGAATAVGGVQSLSALERRPDGRRGGARPIAE